MVWDSFMLAVQDFLRSQGAENYADLINMLTVFQRMGYQMSLMYFHLDFFFQTDTISNEPDERFHQDICELE